MRTCLLLILFIFTQNASAGGTVVGNGGDPIFEFLEAARASMNETLKLILRDKSEQDKVCLHKTFSPEQVSYCRSYFLKILPEILRLNEAASKVPFVLREHPLLVIGPDGKPMPVTARTTLDEISVIEFHRALVKDLLPAQILFLLIHEFQHKIKFEERHTADNDERGPFPYARDLLDGAAESVVAIARRRGTIGSQFGIRDFFDCSINSDPPVQVHISGGRSFWGEDLMSYLSGFGHDHLSESIRIPLSSRVGLVLRLEISEPNNCGDANTARGTKMSIVRSEKMADGSIEESELSKSEWALNPICEKDPLQMQVSWQSYTFDCSYSNSQGTTSARQKKVRFSP